MLLEEFTKGTNVNKDKLYTINEVRMMMSKIDDVKMPVNSIYYHIKKWVLPAITKKKLTKDWEQVFVSGEEFISYIRKYAESKMR